MFTAQSGKDGKNCYKSGDLPITIRQCFRGLKQIVRQLYGLIV